MRFREVHYRFLSNVFLNVAGQYILHIQMRTLTLRAHVSVDVNFNGLYYTGIYDLEWKG